MTAHHRSLFEAMPISVWEEDWSASKSLIDEIKSNGVTDLETHLNDSPETLLELIDRIKVLDVNQATLEMYGSTDKSAFFSKISDKIGPESHETYAHRFAKLANGIGRVVVETQSFRFDGQAFEVRLTTEISESCQHDWHLVHVIVEEISQRRESERRLRQTESLAEIGRLTGGIVHDFNNLLTVIRGNVEAFQMDLATQPEELETVVEAVDKGAQLTRKLLSYVRQHNLAPKIVDLNGLVTGMKDVLTRTLGELVEVKTKSDQDLRAAVVDPTLLENAVLNLAINARDAMPDGGELLIECRNVATSEQGLDLRPDRILESCVALSLTDSGSGMTQTALEHAFEPFFTTKDQNEGSGLGLWMVHSFARQSGGTVTVASKPNRGSKFEIILPSIDQEYLDPLPNSIDINMTGLRILLAQSDKDSCALLAALLQHFGCQVSCAPNGTEAMRMLERENCPDLLFCERTLVSGLSGICLAKQARRIHPRLECVLLASYSPYDPATDQPFPPGITFLYRPLSAYRLWQLLSRQPAMN